MKIFATILIGVTAVLAQQQESNTGPNVSNGPNAISNPNINNGFQAQGSFIDGSDSGSNFLEGLGLPGMMFGRRNEHHNINHQDAAIVQNQ
ncbi:hypothetical protein EV175_000388, partial [Coemansia sp. RSA 1933]